MPRLFHNPRLASPAASYNAELAAILSAEGFTAAKAEIASWPGYAPTPLLELGGIAGALGIGRLSYKDEAWRFGLNSFKALGGAYAVFRVLAAELERCGIARHASSVDLLAGRYREATQDLTVACATDGNHGRSVAWGAQLFGCRCVIFIHETVSEGRSAAIARYGAEIVRVPGTYDDAVREAASQAGRCGWTIVSDTSYPGYAEIPRDVMAGYGVMADEAIEQLAGAIPTHVFVQAGVGGLAASVCARVWQHWGERRPRFVVVEPDRADGCLQSAVAGRASAAAGDLDTIMAGLSCAEVSLIAWPILDVGANDFMTIDDAAALDTVRLLADGRHGDAPLVAGETGVAGLAGAIAAATDPTIRAALRLDANSRLLVFGSEGDTDPDIYKKITGRSAAEIRAATRAKGD